MTDLEGVFCSYKMWSIHAYITQLPPSHPYTASPLIRKHVGTEHQFEHGAELGHKAISRSLEIFAVQPGWEANGEATRHRSKQNRKSKDQNKSKRSKQNQIKMKSTTP